MIYWTLFIFYFIGVIVSFVLQFSSIRRQNDVTLKDLGEIVFCSFFSWLVLIVAWNDLGLNHIVICTRSEKEED